MSGASDVTNLWRFTNMCNIYYYYYKTQKKRTKVKIGSSVRKKIMPYRKKN